MEAAAHALSGCLGGMASMALLYPIDNIRARLQVQGRDALAARRRRLERQSVQPDVDDDCLSNDGDPPVYEGTIAAFCGVLRREGVISLYNGLDSALLGIGVSSAVYFFWYSKLKQVAQSILKKRGGNAQIGPTEGLLVASCAGVINVLLTTPFWVIQTRLAVQAKQKRPETHEDDHYHGIGDAFRKVWKREGLAGLFKGLVPALILVANPAIQFFLYEQFTQTVKNMRTRELAKVGKVQKGTFVLSAMDVFVTGAIAKAIATLATYPYQVVKSRMQVAGTASSSEVYLNTSDAFRQIYEKEGIGAFFNGISAKLSQTVLNSAIMFVVYERILQLVMRLINVRKS